MADPVDREIRLALWKIHVLHHASKHAVYGLWLLDELAEHGHHLSPGTLYPMLARMESNGWIRSQDRTRGRGRRNYRTTAAGRRVLAALRAELTQLYDEVVRGNDADGVQSTSRRGPRGAHRADTRTSR